MSTANFKVSTSKLLSTSSSFNATGKQIKSLTSQMMATISQLNGTVWSGDAQQKYTKQFNQLSDDIQKMLKMINEHVNDLQEIAKNYEDAESNNEARASSLQKDVIV